MSEVIIKMKVLQANSSGIDHGCAPWRDTKRVRFQVRVNRGSTKKRIPRLREWIDFDDPTVYF
jgi:hypothetical protein